MRPLVRLLCLVTALTAAGNAPVSGQGRNVGLIRDAEIENIIRGYAAPIFSAAGLDADATEIHIVNDSRLNAFVSGGQRIFMNTGLLMRAKSPNEVIGVIAHETGHIAGGHLSRLRDEIRNAETRSIIALLAGVAVGLGTGNPGAGSAVLSGGLQVAQTELLKYSRTQEAAADAAALRYLDQTGTSARGLLDFLGLLQRETRLTGGREHPYLSTHPLTRDRISTISNHLSVSRFANAPIPSVRAAGHAIMRAKLIGFMQPLEETLELYPPTEQNVPARYARAIAYYRHADLDNALPLIDGLIAEQPDNPYFHELKGQMLLENGRVGESLAPYQRMVDLAPNEPLLRTALAKAQVESGDETLLEPALGNLQASVRLDSRMRETWRLLTVINGRLGNEGELALSQAEYQLLGGDVKAARSLAERATGLLPHGSPGWLRAQDILGDSERRSGRN